MALFVLRKLIFQNAHAQPPSGARCLIFGRTLRLLPYFMCANSDGSGETARMRSFAWAFAGRICDKYHNLMSWLMLALIKRYGYAADVSVNSETGIMSGIPLLSDVSMQCYLIIENINVMKNHYKTPKISV